jgi:hypothetical protein
MAALTHPVAAAHHADVTPCLQGAWCPVEKQSCPGYYGNLTRLGSTIQFDYCGDVRSEPRCSRACRVPHSHCRLFTLLEE